MCEERRDDYGRDKTGWKREQIRNIVRKKTEWGRCKMITKRW